MTLLGHYLKKKISFKTLFVSEICDGEALFDTVKLTLPLMGHTVKLTLPLMGYTVKLTLPLMGHTVKLSRKAEMGLRPTALVALNMAAACDRNRARNALPAH